jgi:hypothetical protein
MEEQIMNKKIVGILIVLAALFIAAPAFAQLTGTLNLAGQVGKNVAIVVTPNAAASALDLSDSSYTTSGTALTVASVNEKSNFGYDVTVYSANSGQLIDSVSSDAMNYALTYNGVDIGQPPSSATPLNITNSAVRTGGLGVDKSVGIYYTPDAALTASAAFTYVDTLTFTISAK